MGTFEHGRRQGSVAQHQAAFDRRFNIPWQEETDFSQSQMQHNIWAARATIFLAD
jgi:hypothetical protein